MMEIGTQCGEYAQPKENSETKKGDCVETNPRGVHRVVAEWSCRSRCRAALCRLSPTPGVAAAGRWVVARRRGDDLVRSRVPPAAC